MSASAPPLILGRSRMATRARRGRREESALLKALARAHPALAGRGKPARCDVLRHGGMDRVFTRCSGASDVGPVPALVQSGHVRQFDAVAARALVNLAAGSPGLST